MKLSDNTVSILKNFCSINVNLVIEPGNVIRTLAPSRNIFGRAEVTDIFPRQVPIYDLNSFLATVTLFDNVELEFEDKYLVVKSGDATIRYYYSDPSIVAAAPSKEIELTENVFAFELTEADVSSVTKVASVLAAPTISFTSTGGKVLLVVSDRKNATSHSYMKDLGECDREFDVRLRVDAFKLLPGAYKGLIAKKGEVGVVRWENKTAPLVYYMTVDTDSTV